MSTFVALLDAEPIRIRRALLAGLRRAGAREMTAEEAAPHERGVAGTCAMDQQGGAAAGDDAHRPDESHAGQGGVLRRLLRASPELVLVGASGPGCVAAVVHRLLRPRSRLLVWQGEAPARRWTPARLAARVADGVLLGCGLAPQDVPARILPARPRLLDVAGPYDVSAFLHGPSARGQAGCMRIAVRGHLSLDGSGLDVLGEMALLCERQPGRMIHLDWIGEGELRGVLEAQLLPPGLSQRFHGVLDDGAAAQVYRSCDLLLAAHRRDARPAMLAGALASGLLVLFEEGCAPARALVGTAGCGVDPARPGALADALAALLARSPGELDELRAAGRRRALASAPAAFEHRVASAVRRVLEAPAAQPLPTAAPALEHPASAG